MNVIDLAWWKLGLASVLILVLAGLSLYNRLGIARSLLLAAARTGIQLTLVGLVLEALFASAQLHWVVLVAVIMLLVAGREVVVRQRRRLRGGRAFGIGTGSLFVSSFSVAVLTLTVVIGPSPWYTPQYAIPLLGMMLGNAMTGVALCLDRLNDTAWRQRAVIENRLMLGQSWREALEDVRREAMRSGMMPSVNAMAVAGIVSLPGMMTGQILAGSSPSLAVKYQVLIMLTQAAGTGFAAVMAVSWGSRCLFDERERLRLDRLEVKGA